jgi:hypothetical protein
VLPIKMPINYWVVIGLIRGRDNTSRRKARAFINSFNCSLCLNNQCLIRACTFFEINLGSIILKGIGKCDIAGLV